MVLSILTALNRPSSMLPTQCTVVAVRPPSHLLLCLKASMFVSRSIGLRGCQDGQKCFKALARSVVEVLELDCVAVRLKLVKYLPHGHWWCCPEPVDGRSSGVRSKERKGRGGKGVMGG